MAVDLNETLKRLAAIEKDACTALEQKVTAAPRFHYTPEMGMYWNNRPAPLVITEDYGEQFDVINMDVIARFVLAKLTANTAAINEGFLYTLIPFFIDYVNEREGLQSDAYPVFQTDLEWARVAGCSGYTEFVDSTSGTVQSVGTEFTIRLTFNPAKDQQYTG